MDALSLAVFRRYAELVLRKETLRAEFRAVDDEIGKANKAADAIGLDLQKALKEEHDRLPSWVKTQMSEMSGPPAEPEITIKEAALQVLEGATAGLTANEILDGMRDRFGMTYPRSSLSPQLSRLKGDGEIGRMDGRWLLKSYMPEDMVRRLEAPAKEKEDTPIPAQ